MKVSWIEQTHSLFLKLATNYVLWFPDLTVKIHPLVGHKFGFQELPHHSQIRAIMGHVITRADYFTISLPPQLILHVLLILCLKVGDALPIIVGIYVSISSVVDDCCHR